MKIAVVGAEGQRGIFEELGQSGASVSFIESPYEIDGDEEAIFDFLAEIDPQILEDYADAGVTQGTPIFINIPTHSLSSLQFLFPELNLDLIGFNGMTGLFNSKMLEVTLPEGKDDAQVKKCCEVLGMEYRVVEDRIGMVTPRVVCMIINEAYFTLQEGTAGIADIDTGMKLGTNYPKGPFEWAESMGVDRVYELLEAVYEDTHDERYIIAPLLKKEYLKRIT